MPENVTGTYIPPLLAQQPEWIEWNRRRNEYHQALAARAEQVRSRRLTMLRIVAFLLLFIATLMVLFTSFHIGRFHATAFVYFGLTVWCFSTIWDHALVRRRSE